MGALKTKKEWAPTYILPPGLVPDDPSTDEYLELDGLTGGQINLACANSNVAAVSLTIYPEERWNLLRALKELGYVQVLRNKNSGEFRLMKA